MAHVDFTRFTSRLLAEPDCGPDLDAAGDDDHLAFLARVEGVLPPSFAEFDRAAINVPAETQAAFDLIDRSRDLRVLVLLAKITILDRRLDDFAAVIAGIAALLEARWQEVHPAGDMDYRRGVLMTLDDMPHCCLPLQSAALFESRNLGRVSYRQVLLATGAARPRDNEAVAQASALSGALERANQDELEASHAALETIRRGLASIAGAFAVNLGAGRELALPNMQTLVAGQADWLGAELARRLPATVAAPPSSETAAAGTQAAALPGEIASQAEALAALGAVCDYLARNEPSSVGLLLVRQCRQLANVSFLEVLRTLMPDSLPAASIRVGKDSGFSIPMERLSPFESEGEAEARPEALPEALPDAQTVDQWAGDGQQIADEAGDGSGDREAMPATALGQAGRPAPPPIASAREAGDLLARVAEFYRLREPSSPLPLLLDRARSLMGRDFLTLLEEMLPVSHLQDVTGQ